MRKLLPLIACGVVAMAGCGSSSSSGSGSSAKASATTSAQGALIDTAKACTYQDPTVAPSTGLPMEILPKQTLVLKNTTGGTQRGANFFFGQGVQATYDSIVAAAKAAGYKRSRSESEGFEAEIYLAKGAEKITIRLADVQRCRASATGLIAIVGQST